MEPGKFRKKSVSADGRSVSSKIGTANRPVESYMEVPVAMCAGVLQPIDERVRHE